MPISAERITSRLKSIMRSSSINKDGVLSVNESPQTSRPVERSLLTTVTQLVYSEVFSAGTATKF